MTVSSASTKTPDVVIASGLGAGLTGVGRVVAYLAARATAFPKVQVNAGAFGTRASLRALLRRAHLFSAVREVWRRRWERRRTRAVIVSAACRRAGSLVIIHPQTLGFARTLETVRARAENTWLFVMDASFFCLRSYNHLQGENAPCLRCLGGEWHHATENGCAAFPDLEPWTVADLGRLRELVANGRLGILAQNRNHQAILRKHFGPRSRIVVVGLWAKDWDDLGSEKPAPGRRRGPYDVVLHSPPHPAKGACWALELAREMPTRRFLFPYPRPSEAGPQDLPPNIDFQPMSWETGLRSEIERSPVTLVPSLWSAPIEGALVKSISAGRAVAVAENSTCYSDELPPGLLIRLPVDPALAAEALETRLEESWTPEPGLKASWMAEFRMHNEQLVERLLRLGDAARRGIDVAGSGR